MSDEKINYDDKTQSNTPKENVFAWAQNFTNDKIDTIINPDYELLLLDTLKNNWEILLPKVISDDYEVVTTFYFSERDRWIIMSNIFNGEIYLTNLRMPWDGFRSMLFAIKYALDRKAEKLSLSACPQKRVPQMERRLKVLKDFYSSFWFIDTHDNIMSLDLKNKNIYEFLHKKILEYLKTWKWDMTKFD